MARITRGGRVEDTITAFKDFSFQYEFAQNSEGYLGETTERKDEIFNGISGSFTVHQESQDILFFQQAIKERAQRKVAVNGQRINITARLTFPNGETPRVIIPDVKFGATPNNVPGRADYVNTAFTYAAEDARIIPG